MRVVILGEDRIEVRGLMRTELTSELKELGYSRWGFEPPKDGDDLPDHEKTARGLDLILDMVLGPERVGEIEKNHSFDGLRKVWRGVLKETYGDGDEEKNLSTSGPTDQTQTDESRKVAIGANVGG